MTGPADQRRDHPAAHAQARWTPGRTLRALTLATLGLLAVRVGLRTARDLRAYRAADRRLARRWTTVPGHVDGRPVRLRARVHAADASGRPIVLVHGYGVASSYFVPLAGALAAELGGLAPVLAPDLPGHGASGRECRPLTVPELAGALGAWMDASGVGGALLVGQSLGCQIATQLAVTRPELAAGLVLVSPTLDDDLESTLGVLARGAVTAPFESPALDLVVLAEYARVGPQLMWAEMRHMLEHDLQRLLPQLRLPVRVVRGEHDYVVPADWAAEVARLAGAPAPVVVARWGHAVHFEAPEAVAAVVLALHRALEAQHAAACDGRARP